MFQRSSNQKISTWQIRFFQKEYQSNLSSKWEPPEQFAHTSTNIKRGQGALPPSVPGRFDSIWVCTSSGLTPSPEPGRAHVCSMHLFSNEHSWPLLKRRWARAGNDNAGQGTVLPCWSREAFARVRSTAAGHRFYILNKAQSPVSLPKRERKTGLLYGTRQSNHLCKRHPTHPGSHCLGD